MKMCPVVHFELPATDQKKLSEFYEKVFGWHAADMGTEIGNYVVVTTTETDGVGGRPKTPGAINGGIYKKDEAKQAQHPSFVIAVEDIHQAMKEVAEAGGTVLGGQTAGEPDNIPGVGLFAGIIDPQGNTLAMLQPSPEM